MTEQQELALQGVGVPPPQRPQTRREHDDRWAQVQAEWHASPEGRPFAPAEQGRRTGHAGAEDARDGLPAAVRSSVHEAIRRRSGPFTSDSLHGDLTQSARDVLRHPHHRNALAGIITTSAREGVIRFTGQYVRSVRPEARGRMLKVWERVLP